MKRTIMFTLAGILAAGAALAQGTDSWDTDTDGSVSRGEWTTGMGGDEGFST